VLKIKNIIFYWLLIFIQSIPAINPQDESVKNLVLQGIDFSLNNRFTEAEQVFDRLILQHPQHPIGYFYKAATVQAEMLDAEDFRQEEQFYDLTERTVQLADSLQKTGKADGWISFYKGSAFLYQSFMKMKTGSWLSAYKDASRGVTNLEEALAQDSLIYEAYLGIGSFKYWKSTKAEFLLWLPFISDQREQGVSMIYQAIDRGEFIRYIARDQLVWILMDKGDYREALRLARQNHEVYPESRFFKWTLAAAAFHSREWELSRMLYEELLQQVQQLPENNHLNEIECLVKIAEISANYQQWQEVYQLADRALRFNLAESVRKRAKNKLKQALTLRKQAEQKIRP
jgi:tetratricopeptide (TPR) repeat protein